MTRLRFSPSLSSCLLVAALVLICTSTLPAQEGANKPPKTMTWVLTQGTVINPGQSTQTADGLLITGYVVEAAVQAQGRAKVATGKFSITCSIKQQGDKFQLRGAWDITRGGAAKKAHHTPDSIKGTLVADLVFNPTVASGTIDGKVMIVPMRRHGGKEVKATGTFTGNEKFEGTLTLSRK